MIIKTQNANNFVENDNSGVERKFRETQLANFLAHSEESSLSIRVIKTHF